MVTKNARHKGEFIVEHIHCIFVSVSTLRVESCLSGQFTADAFSLIERRLSPILTDDVTDRLRLDKTAIHDIPMSSPGIPLLE